MAKILKEKGFNEYCDAYYHLYWMKECTEDESFEISSSKCFKNSNNVYRVGAPTLYEAQKWLRNEHGIYVTIISSPITWLYKNNDGSYITHFPVITYRDTEGKIKMSYHQGMNDSEYEKAFNYAILEALKLI